MAIEDEYGMRTTTILPYLCSSGFVCVPQLCKVIYWAQIPDPNEQELENPKGVVLTIEDAELICASLTRSPKDSYLLAILEKRIEEAKKGWH